MVEKLMAEANAEASQKALCDKEEATSSTPKEEKTAKLDKYIARTDKATTTVATLEESVKSLEAELSDTDATMSEASKLRAVESEEYVSSCGWCPLHYMILTVFDSFGFILVPKHTKIG